MNIFFTDDELKSIPQRTNAGSGFYWHLLGQASKISANPGLHSEHGTEHYHHVFESVSTVAAACRIKKDPQNAAWLRTTGLSLAAMTEDQWIGPWFRDHTSKPSRGHLETAHLSMALALSLDMAEDVFSEAEKEEIRTALKTKAIAQCKEWMKNTVHVTNWRCILLAGAAVAAAVLKDKETLEFALAEYKRCCDFFQPDGTYGESLQYEGYAAWGMMMTYEALVRSMPEKSSELSIPYTGLAKWTASSLIANRPVSGWGDMPRPRTVNFNDSGAIAATHPDILLQIASRAKHSNPDDAALSKYLFDELYSKQPSQGPFDRSSFGFIPRYGFMTLCFLGSAAEAASPEKLKLPLTHRFSCGAAIARNSWQSEGSLLAMSSIPEALHCTGHLHADLNSITVAYDGEVFLADPGHCCYRNVIHKYETSTQAHNTCVFFTENGKIIEQETAPSRKLDASPVRRPGRHLITARINDLSVFANDAAEAYGAPLTEFTRICIAAGKHAVFVIDRINSSKELKTSWNWLANNRDGELEYKVFPERMVFRRGQSGMKFFVVSESGALTKNMASAFVHDAYHPLPAQNGEGRSGSGLVFSWTEPKAVSGARTTIYGLALDSYGSSAGWHFRNPEKNTVGLEAPGAAFTWTVKINENSIEISDSSSGRNYLLDTKNWKLSETK